jgi:predicted pyridoxine 5'-phosphate oxidase superfamily flavin-nucleotide-binding protein
MGTVYAAIDDEIREWIERQQMFFVATAPSGDGGHVNLSPKGAMQQTFRVLGPHRVAYVDLFGSGIETAAHLYDNRRIVVMLCAFEGPPKIIRLHGQGRVVEQHQPEHDELITEFELDDPVKKAARAIIDIEVTRIADSCGFVVPQMTFEAERRQLFKTAEAWTRKRGADAVRDYCDVNNDISIDRLPGLRRLGARVTAAQRETYDEQNRKL